MKARIAAIAVIVLLTLSVFAVVFAVGFSALGEPQDITAAAAESGQESGENSPVSTFKFVCPFH